jgi:hypothetical protein
MRNALLALAAVAGIVAAAGSAEARPMHYYGGHHYGWSHGHHYGWRNHHPRPYAMHHRWAGHHRHWH